MSLTEIKLPKSIRGLAYAFSGCYNLYKVTVEWNDPNNVSYYNPNNEFNDIFPESFLYVPKGTVDLYKKTLPWSKFKYIIEEDTPAQQALVLNEDVNSYDYLTQTQGEYNDVDLYLNRTLTPNEWTTLVLPVSLTLDQFNTTFGADAKLAELTGLNSQDFRFTVKSRKNIDGNATFVEANRAYLLKATTAPSSANADYTATYTTADGKAYNMEAKKPNYVISHVTLDKKNLTMGDTFNNLPALKNADTYRYGDVTATFYGTLLQTDEADNFLGSYSFVDGKFYNFQAPYGFKAFRGWLTAINAAGQPVKMRAEVYDGSTSEIVNLHVDGKQSTKGKVYNMQGQVVSNNGSVENLPAGMYIVNNKKVIVKH